MSRRAQQAGASGIVYTLSRNDAESVAAYLQARTKP